MAKLIYDKGFELVEFLFKIQNISRNSPTIKSQDIVKVTITYMCNYFFLQMLQVMHTVIYGMATHRCYHND